MPAIDAQYIDEVEEEDKNEESKTVETGTIIENADEVDFYDVED